MLQDFKWRKQPKAWLAKDPAPEDEMTPKDPVKTKADARRARLSASLRENLKRRKAQIRQRASTAAEPPNGGRAMESDQEK